MKKGKKQDPEKKGKGANLILNSVVVAALISALALVYVNRKPEAPVLETKAKFVPASVTNLPSGDSSAQISIIDPINNGLALFDTSLGQGGTVKVRGQSKNVDSNMVILLVMIASDNVEQPQLGGAPIHPDSTGQWFSNVQVGDQNSPPKIGDKFLVKAFIIEQTRFDELKHRQVAWQTIAAQLTPIASVSFQLADKITS